MQWKLFANLAEAAGDRTVSVDLDTETTVGEALDALLADRPALRAEVLDDEGELRDHVNLLRNGTNVANEADMETPVGDDDELALFPPVSGG